MVFIVLVILSVSAFCGKLFSQNYSKRETFFTELENFCLFLKTEICFSQTKVGAIYEKFERTYKIKNSAIFNAMKMVSENKTDEKELNNCYFLKTSEKEKMIEFATEIGRTDEKNQVLNIEHFLESVKIWKSESIEKKKQNQPLCYKLCLAFGALVCILIL